MNLLMSADLDASSRNYSVVYRPASNLRINFAAIHAKTRCGTVSHDNWGLWDTLNMQDWIALQCQSTHPRLHAHSWWLDAPESPTAYKPPSLITRWSQLHGAPHYIRRAGLYEAETVHCQGYAMMSRTALEGRLRRAGICGDAVQILRSFVSETRDCVEYHPLNAR